MIGLFESVKCYFSARFVLWLSIFSMVILSFGCSKSDEGVDTPSAVEVRVETSGAETLSS